MRVFVTGGSDGQLYSELHRSCFPGFEIIDPGSERLDITDSAKVAQVISDTAPDCIINAAAYTAVDKAEEDVELAYAINEQGVVNLATAAVANNCRLIHVSTDFVFGDVPASPITPSTATDPISIYGKSKLAGEQRLLELMPENSLVVRTAWVYSSFGNNFVKTMLRLMKERDELGVIADQIGSPTWANSLAVALWRALENKSNGILHWTGAGVASWYDFAQAIMEEGVAIGLLEQPLVINPLRTDQYPTPAARPPYSVLETTVTRAELKLPAVHWREELRRMLRELV